MYWRRVGVRRTFAGCKEQRGPATGAGRVAGTSCMKNRLLRLLPGWLLLAVALLPAAARAQLLTGTLTSGSGHCLVLTPDGHLQAWGNNAAGQLGDGTATQRTRPVAVTTGSNWASVAASWQHSLALAADGSLWAWGNNTNGQLGDGTLASHTTPTLVPGTQRWRLAATGFNHSAAIGTNGTLWTWGGNDFGQLGDGSTTDRRTPAQLGTDNTWVAVSCGGFCTLALKADGTLWAWGYNNDGQLGDGSTTDRWLPTRIGTATSWLAIDAGFTGSMGIQADGTLWSWGRNREGQVGDGTTTQRNSPVRVGADRAWRQARSGGAQSAAIAADGTLWVWGSNDLGQLGQGYADLGLHATPVQVGSARSWTSVCAANHLLALQANGTVWAWGYNAYGQVGNGSTGTVVSPTRVSGVAGLPTRSLSAGYDHAAAITPGGRLVAWGRNDYGQLGDGSTTQRLRPATATPADNWAQVSCGAGYTLGLKADGTLWAWGYNGSGQLGDAMLGASSTPRQVGADRLWRQVDCGHDHTLAIAADGTLWGWGANASGQVGNDSRTNATTPVQLRPSLRWRSVAAGYIFSLAIAADGSLGAWGNNGYGQLGDGSTTDRLSSVRVGSGNAWTQVSAGVSHAAGVQANGTAWAWGRNDAGQLGNATLSTPQLTPIQVSTGTNWQEVAAGNKFTVGRWAGGALYAWGLNTDGQLGDGTTTARSAFTREASAGTAWLTIAAGDAFALARTPEGGSFYSTGSNGNGQLGDGTTAGSLRYTRTGSSTGQPLPVRLVSFGARRQSPAFVALRWVTASETDNAGFGVESSPDGHAWTRRAWVPGTGRAHSYATTVAESADAYYRLAQTDLNGTVAYSPVRFVPGSGAATLGLYPNPAPGAAELHGAAAGATISVLDATGRLALAATADALGQARLVLPPGLYLVRVGSTTLRLAVQ
jgi:alpha-tubulin suppressor-like RCC1 family protein